MSEIVKYSRDQLIQMSTHDIKEELTKVLTVTAENLAYMAMLWRELEERGEDLSGIKGGMMEYIQLIAAKRIDARLVVEYAGRKTLLNYLSKLSTSEQQKIIETGKVDIVIENDGEYFHKSLSLVDADISQISQAFDPFSKSGLRSEAKQIEMMEAKASPKAIRKRRITKVEIDPKSKTLIAGGKNIMLESVLEAIEKAYNIKIDIE